MELFGLLSSFGGGLLGAAIGGTSSFILTGFIAISGAIIALCTGNSDVLNLIAFGSFLGPHIIFQGSVAATAYARRKHMIKNGADINQSLHILESSSILLIGGIFGLFGYLVKYGFEQIITLPWESSQDFCLGKHRYLVILHLNVITFLIKKHYSTLHY